MSRNSFVFLLFVFIFSANLYSQRNPLAGYNSYRFSLARWGQDINYNATSSAVDAGTYWGIDTYGSWIFGDNISENVFIGFYGEAAFGFSFDFSKDFPSAVGIHLAASPGLAVVVPIDEVSFGLKTTFTADFDRISALGIGIKPTVQYGPLFIEAGTVIPIGDSKDHELKQFDIAAYLLMGSVGFGVKMDLRSGSNMDKAKTRANLNQFHLCLMFNP